MPVPTTWWHDVPFTLLLGKPAWLWLAFFIVVAALLAFDLGLLGRRQRSHGIGASLRLSALYVAVSVAFGGWIWFSLGLEPFTAFMTGFLVEKTLALDNVFVISMIFGYLAIPVAQQHRVLFWGIVGVLVLRGVMIGLGATLIARFDWLLLLFAAFLVVTGLKMLVTTSKPADVGASPVLRWFRRVLPVTDTLHGERFLVRQPDPATGRATWAATPLLVALVLIETADLVFAVDSIPAVFSITTDPFIVYTSNIFAIIGLRALYFAVAAMVDRFHHLRVSLALVLVFIGAKAFWAHFVGKPDPLLAFAVTVVLLGGGIVASLLMPRRAEAAAGR